MLQEPAPGLTIADALEAYGSFRVPQCGPLETPGVEAVLGIVSSFCDEVLPDLLDPVTRHRCERGAQAAASEPRDVLGAPLLARALGPCARLLPYQVVAGSGVLAVFRDEVPRLARWLRRKGVFSTADEAAFFETWRAARPDLQQHLELQQAIEADLQRGFAVYEAELVQGHFEIERITPRGMFVNGGAAARGPVRFPERFAGLFEPGRCVSLVFRRALAGWRLVASALPYPENGLDALCGGGRTGRP